MIYSRIASFPSAFLVLCCFAITILAVPSLASTTIYTYTNDDGVQTFTNELDSVPEKYRPQLTQRTFQSEAAPPPPTSAAAADPPIRSVDVRTITASGEYRMGDHDNRADAIRLATEAAKRDALEQVATYVERITDVRNLDVTRDDLRSFTAGIVKVLDQAVTTRLEQDHVVVRVDLTAEVEPQDVVQAIAALRENDQARQELLTLQAETDRLQAQVDDTNRALAAATTPSDVQHYTGQREEMLDQLQANALLSQAWTSWTYPTLGLYSYPWFGAPGINGLLLQAQRLAPHHRHLPLAQRTIPAYNNTAQLAQPPGSTAPRPSLQVPPLPHLYRHQAPPLLNSQGQQAKVGDVVVIPTPRSVPTAPQQSAQSTPYKIHPNHFWRPSPPNIQTMPSASSSRPSVSMAPHAATGSMSSGGHSHGGGGHRGR